MVRPAASNRPRSQTEHALVASVDALLAPASLSALLQHPIRSVQPRPQATEFGKSGSHITFVETNGGDGPRLVLKRISPVNDWLMRATGDVHGRSVTLWQQGVLDRLPPELEHGVVACARDGLGWALLMHDVSQDMLPYAPLTAAANDDTLEAMAALHARFWQDESLGRPRLGLCGLPAYFAMFTPRVAGPEAGGENPVPGWVLAGWELVRKTAPAAVTAAVTPLLEDPEPLCRALAGQARTLVHGDWRHANQAYRPAAAAGAARVVMLDWQLALYAPPVLDLVRYLLTNSALLPAPKEAVIAQFRHKLAARLGNAFSDDWWRPQLALGLLGGYIQDAWAIMLKATSLPVGANARQHWRADLDWWAGHVLDGVAWLS